jgi:hypothetical protein
VKFIIKVTPYGEVSDEFKTLQHFLDWQNIQYLYEKTMETVKLTSGISHIYIKINVTDNMFMSFNGFHELYQYMKSNGLILI